jgi:hypothetical protein
MPAGNFLHRAGGPVPIVPIFIENMQWFRPRRTNFIFSAACGRSRSILAKAIPPENYLPLSREDFHGVCPQKILATRPQNSVATSRVFEAASRFADDFHASKASALQRGFKFGQVQKCKPSRVGSRPKRGRKNFPAMNVTVRHRFRPWHRRAKPIFHPDASARRAFSKMLAAAFSGVQ